MPMYVPVKIYRDNVLECNDLPICDVCKKSVERMTLVEKIEGNKYTAYCHGQQEIAMLDSVVLIGTQISMGRAFATKRLK